MLLFNICEIARFDVGRNMSSGICEQRRPRSNCASAQADQDLRCPQTESLDTTECFNGEQMHGRGFAHVQDDVNPYILRMPEGTFSLDVAHLQETEKTSDILFCDTKVIKFI